MSRLAAELPRCMVGFLAGAGAYYWSAPCFKSNARRRPGHHSGTGATARQPVAGRAVKWLYRQADAAAFRKLCGGYQQACPQTTSALTNDFFRRIWRNSYSCDARPSGRRCVREESGETTGEFRIDLERVIVDPDYRRRVLARLR